MAKRYRPQKDPPHTSHDAFSPSLLNGQEAIMVLDCVLCCHTRNPQVMILTEGPGKFPGSFERDIVLRSCGRIGRIRPLISSWQIPTLNDGRYGKALFSCASKVPKRMASVPKGRVYGPLFFGTLEVQRYFGGPVEHPTPSRRIWVPLLRFSQLLLPRAQGLDPCLSEAGSSWVTRLTPFILPSQTRPQ